MRAGIFLVAGLIAASPVAGAEEVFASRADQIIEALRDKDGTHQIDGQRYEVKDRAVYKLLPNGMKARVRGVTIRKVLSPKVCLPIEFEVDSATPTAEGGIVLRELGKALSSDALAGSSYVVVGHTDGDGDEQYNLRLSEKRAEKVRQELVKIHHLPEGRLVVEARGESRPIASNEGAEGKARNRRVEIIRLIE